MRKIILITGANGFIGTFLSPYLRNLGYEVKRLVRLNSHVIEDYINYVVPDINKHKNWKEIMIDVDIVIHLASQLPKFTKKSKYFYEDINGTDKLIDAAIKFNVKKFIFMSSIAANISNNKNFNIAKRKYFFSYSNYVKTKYEIEELIKRKLNSTKCKYTIIRAPLIYGKNLNGSLLNLSKAIKYNIPLPFKNINNKKSVLSIENLSSFIVSIIIIPNYHNDLFFISDDYQPSTEEIIEVIAKKINKKPLLFYLPFQKSFFFNKLLNKYTVMNRFFGSIQIDNSYAKKTLKWRPKGRFSDHI